MSKVLYILGLLSDTDIDWLATTGEKVMLKPGDKLVEEGTRGEHMYVILSGELEVSARGKALARRSVGEVIGEVSLIDSRGPTATVVTISEVTALRVAYDDIRGRLASDRGFAARIYRALAIFLAQRMRSMALLATGAAMDVAKRSETEMPNEIDPSVQEEITLAGSRLQRLLDRFSAVA